jgi:hypothetical protein
MHKITLKWFKTMQVDLENCAKSFVGQFLVGILINEGNIA